MLHALKFDFAVFFCQSTKVMKTTDLSILFSGSDWTVAQQDCKNLLY